MKNRYEDEFLSIENREQAFRTSDAPDVRREEKMKFESQHNRILADGNLTRTGSGTKGEKVRMRKESEQKIKSQYGSEFVAESRRSGKGSLGWASFQTSFVRVQKVSFIIFAFLASFLITLPVSAISDSLYAISPCSTEQATASSQNSLEQLDQVLKALEKFDHSQGEGPALALDRLIFSLKDDQTLRLAAEKKLLQFFAGPVTTDARIAVSKPLSWIAGSESVKALSPFIADPEKSDPARFVLERIPGEEVNAALIAALEKAPAEVIPGIISSLGHRRATAAVPQLEKLLKKNPSPAVVVAALEALGNIGGSAASNILLNYLKSGDEKIRLLAADSLLRTANREIENRQYEAASTIASSLLKATLTPAEKLAAWKVKILAAGDKGEGEIQAALKSRDDLARQATIGLIPRLVPKDKIDSYLGLFSGLPDNLQVQVAAVLANYPVKTAREYLLNLAAKSPAPEVRTEAMVSLGKIGDSSTVEFLAGKAATSRGNEKAAARESLAALRGKEVDKKILEMLSSTAEQALRNELLLAACERNIRESREFFLKEAASPSADLALVSRGLRAFGDISLAEELLNITYENEDEAFREEMAGIMAVWAKQSARPDARSGYFRNLLSAEKQPERQALLISIIGKIGERNSLPLLRNYLKSQDPKVREASVRALSDWPEVEARDDLWLIARSSSDLKEKVLAIRGLVRLTASERYRRPEAVVDSLKEIYSLCPRAEERKLVLAAFPEFSCEPGLSFCQSLASDPEVGAEARTAAEKISQRLRR
ncbi:MAG: HEAT repeat domain-containing protein [Candidatus Aminicenantes bacterium]|nr:HEAT repeat domain-containing protein [Candidatus Aminicenantes bacterium]